MKINKAYKVELNLNNKQKIILEKSFGCVRFVYNWGLNRRIELYKNEKKSITMFNQMKELSVIKKLEFPWMYEVSNYALQGALKDLDKAFKNFFKGIKQGKDIGFPKFKLKYRGKNSFKYYGKNYLRREKIKIPKCGEVRLKEKNYIPLEGVKYNSIIISKEAGRYFASVQCEVETQEPKKATEILGIDLGVKTLATCSDGTVFENPKALHKKEKQLKRTQRSVSRKKKGSNNRKKAIIKLQKVHYKIKNIRKNYIHKMTSLLVKTKPRVIVLENLNIQGMLKNHKLAKSLSDASFYEIRRQLEYKTKWYGGEVFFANRFFSSSKTCSKCGNIKKDLKLSDRIYICECGLNIDRDLNAAINLKNYYIKQNTVNSTEFKACGENIRPNAMMQEAVFYEARKKWEGVISDSINLLEWLDN